MALTATDWTVTVQDRNIEGKKKRNRCQCVLTDGTYPSNGIPQPSSGDLGMVRNTDYVIMLDSDQTLYKKEYDLTNTSIRIYKLSTASIVAQNWIELATTVTVDSTVLDTIFLEAVGW